MELRIKADEYKSVEKKVEREKIKEFSIKKYPSNLRLFVNGLSFLYSIDGEHGEYVKEEYYDYCWEKLTYLLEDFFKIDQKIMQQMVEGIMFYLDMGNFYREREDDE